MAQSNKFIETAKDLGCSIIAGALVAVGLYCFSTYNGFVPGGLTGISMIISQITGLNAGYIMLMFNLPLFLLLAIFVERKLGLYLTVYLGTQSLLLILLKDLQFPYYYKATNGNLIFASIATGVVTGLGFALQISRHGASGGTYAITALIKHWRPAANIAWVTFALDSSVVVFASFYYRSIEAVICTLLNLFIANAVVDYCFQGTKAGYKFEIVTDDPETISQEIIKTLKHGVTEMRVNGMYTHKERYMIICIIRKRELSKMMKLLKNYPHTFASFSRVNEVFGNFKK
ncbi:MAG: YitT family protein [Candidatus Borkfalkiaceae bacterium]|nr:YitT family protein [Christensenellaceae bacterium]